MVIPWWGRWAALAVLALALVAFGYVKGNAHGSQKLLDYQQAQAKEGNRIAKVRTKITERVLTKYLTVTMPQTQAIANSIEREVGNYENAKLDTCILSTGATRLHDAAAANRLPDAARAADGTASGIETSTLVKTATENYATCHAIRDRLIGLQTWIGEQARVK